MLGEIIAALIGAAATLGGTLLATRRKEAAERRVAMEGVRLDASDVYYVRLPLSKAKLSEPSRSTAHTLELGDQGQADFTITPLRVGDYIRVVTVPDARRISVNLRSSEGWVYHFNPRFDGQALVENSKRAGTWGEQRIKPLPDGVQRGKELIVTLHIAPTAIVPTVGNEVLEPFRHRMPISTVDNIMIKCEGGALRVASVEIGDTFEERRR